VTAIRLRPANGRRRATKGGTGLTQGGAVLEAANGRRRLFTGVWELILNSKQQPDKGYPWGAVLPTDSVQLSRGKGWSQAGARFTNVWCRQHQYQLAFNSVSRLREWTTRQAALQVTTFNLQPSNGPVVAVGTAHCTTAGVHMLEHTLGLGLESHGTRMWSRGQWGSNVDW